MFNTTRGLVLESVVFPERSAHPLLGTIPHGHYDYVPLNADWYTGDVVSDAPGERRVSDLQPVRGLCVEEDARGVVVRGRVPFGDGFVDKRICVNQDGSIDLAYESDVQLATPCTLHVAHLTLMPGAFDRASLFYSCHDGGEDVERFELAQVKSVEHRPVSLLVSSNAVLGNTTGTFALGDATTELVITTNPAALAALPFIEFLDVRGRYFFQACFSVAEFDDTTRLRRGAPLPVLRFCCTISARSGRVAPG